MKTIETIKHIVAYEQKSFIADIINTIKVLEEDKQEVDIQYSYANEKYTALVIGRKVETNGKSSVRSSKTV